LNYGKIDLPNVNFDTGKKVVPDDYRLVDDTYSQLLLKLQDAKFSYVTNPLKQNMISFYSQADTVALAKEDASAWKKTSAALLEIKAVIPITTDSLKSAETLQEQKRMAKTTGAR